MRKLQKAFFGAVIGMVAAGLVGAADTASHLVQMQVREICVLDVTAAPGNLSIEPPTTGGQTPADSTDNTTYLQYTSTVASGKTRTLTASMGTGESAPAGCALKLTATPSGGTNQGTTAGQKTLSTTAETIVTTIRSCATGTAASDGARLAYVLTVTDVTALVADQSKQVTITFTLTDAA